MILITVRELLTNPIRWINFFNFHKLKEWNSELNLKILLQDKLS